MAQPPTIHQGDVDELLLDPRNPRLRRAHDQGLLDQEALFEEMLNWELEELIVSILTSGFWQHEPLLVVREHNVGLDGLVVVEGNRRAASLKCIRKVLCGHKLPSRRYERIVSEALAGRNDLSPASPVFTEVPYVEYEGREEIDAYLGFRHVSGVKEWRPQEKAAFITHLIDGREYDYAATARLIGMKAETVRRNYIAFHLLNTFEQVVDSRKAQEALERARDDFSVFFLSLREEGIRSYLGVSLDLAPREVRDGIRGVDPANAERFLRWLFGSDDEEALVPESRDIKKFAQVLSTPSALE